MIPTPFRLAVVPIPFLSWGWEPPIRPVVVIRQCVSGALSTGSCEGGELR